MFAFSQGETRFEFPCDGMAPSSTRPTSGKLAFVVYTQFFPTKQIIFIHINSNQFAFLQIFVYLLVHFLTLYISPFLLSNQTCKNTLCVPLVSPKVLILLNILCVVNTCINCVVLLGGISFKVYKIVNQCKRRKFLNSTSLNDVISCNK